MKIDKELILELADQAIELNHKLHDGIFYRYQLVEQCCLRSLSLLKSVYGVDSNEYTTLMDFLNEYRNNIRLIDRGEKVDKIRYYNSAVLDTLKTEVQYGLIETIENKVTGKLYGDFIIIARHLIEEGNKEAAAILASAALEDSMKKVAIKHALEVEDNSLDKVVNALISKSIIKGTQSAVVKSYIAIRNKAFHAQFNKIEVPEVKSLIAFVEAFLLENY